MPSPYETLGISQSSSTDEVRAAYRKLASKHHPDKGGDAEKFKEVQRAYDDIGNGYTSPPAPPAPSQPTKYPRSSFTKPEPAFEGFAPLWEQEQMRSKARQQWNGLGTRPTSEAYRTAAPKITSYVQRVVQAYRPPEVRTNAGDFVARVSISEAFQGFICEVQVDGKKYQVKIPPGVPHDLRFTVPIEGRTDVTVITRFTQSVYTYIGVSGALCEGAMVNGEPAKVYRTKDLSIRHEISKGDLANGKSFTLTDIDGSQFTVQVPRRHDVRDPIVIEGRGYYDWYSTFSKAGSVRGSLTIRLSSTEEVPMSHLIR